MKTSKDQQVKRITDQILLRVKSGFDNHKRRVQKLNTDKNPGGSMKTQIVKNFYEPININCQELKKLQSHLKKSQKIRKERRQLWDRKITQFIETLQSYRRNKQVIKIKINDYLIKLNSDTQKCIEQANTHLKNYQNQTKVFCGKSYDFKPSVQRSMTELCQLGCLWASLNKFQSITNDSVNEIYLPVEFDKQQFEYIQSEIKNVWPDPQVQYIDKQVKVKDDSHLREAHQMLFGFTTSQNVQKAIKIYQEEEKKSICHPKALLALGELYEKGTYLKKDTSKAIKYFKKCAQSNDPQGLYKTGQYLQKGVINSKDIFGGLYPNRQAQIRGGIQYYQKAAKLDHEDAITDLGFIYQKGILNEQGPGYFIEPMPQYALKYYQKAKKFEFPRGYNNLGNLLITCSSLPEDVAGGNLQKGIKYLERAVAMKYQKAYLNLGKCYENGIGVPQSIDKARALYLDGAQAGDMQCKLSFVKCCLGNKIDDQKTLIKMLQLTRQVLAQDSYNQQALYYMGLFLEQGIGIQKNKQSSFYYIETSARMDYPPAIKKLGDYYYSGYYVNKDTDYARALYERAAAKGQAKALANLGVMFQKGISTQNDPKRAQELYQEAATLGNPHALIFLSTMKDGGVDHKDAITQAASMGSMYAQKMVKTSNILVPKKKNEGNSYEQTLKSMQNYYTKAQSFRKSSAR